MTSDYEPLYLLEVKLQGVPKKGTNRMLLEPQCTGSITSSKHALGLGNVYFARFLLRLSRIKGFQDISMGGILALQHSIFVMIFFS